MPTVYVPDAGDIVWINFDPQAGHEQAKHRPAEVLSSAGYNHRTDLFLCCPTTKIKGYPFEVKLSGRPATLADQVKSFDWRARKAQKRGRQRPANLPKSAPNSTHSLDRILDARKWTTAKSPMGLHPRSRRLPPDEL